MELMLSYKYRGAISMEEILLERKKGIFMGYRVRWCCSSGVECLLKKRQ
jgi:hypothetical protein